MQVLSEASGAALEPLVEACRPEGEGAPHDMRRTIEAIIWRCRDGAKWRSLPEELGPWSRAAQPFIRWSQAGVWERLLEKAQQTGLRLGIVRLDGTVVRAHAKAAVAPNLQKEGSGRGRGRAREALGRSRGGHGTKASVLCDGAGRALAFALQPGQAHELSVARPLLARLPGRPGWVVSPEARTFGNADRGHSDQRLREHIRDLAGRPARRNQPAERPLEAAYANRQQVERLWGRLKEWRAVATRYEKTACSFHGALCLAANADRAKI